ncbi:mammalian cell entry protein [Mycolicibacterium palauense]|uniref:mammalian cell entry protein n=1 Tax=Mycolicibacterium palauense TaxID=2034511 RepID=UPI000BFEC3DB|nr:mammalian cell entry protein [Mycolicibacterium palauense]
MRRLTTVLAGLLVGLSVVGIVGLAGAGGWLYWDRVQQRAEQATRAELAPLAREQLPKVFGYDYQTVERSITEASTLLTPRFRREFEDQANKQIIPEARERHVISQPNVVGVGVLEALRNSGSVMVYLNQTVTDKSEQPTYVGSRLRVEYQKVDGRWLIDGIDPI